MVSRSELYLLELEALENQMTPSKLALVNLQPRVLPVMSVFTILIYHFHYALISFSEICKLLRSNQIEFVDFLAGDITLAA